VEPPVASRSNRESVVFRWVHSFLAYGLAAYIVSVVKATPYSAWIVLLPFLFSSVMCRVVSSKDLKEMMENAGNIIDKRKPRQRTLE
jgi:hypothetical protein